MKKLALLTGLIVLTLSFDSRANWTDTSITEPTLGCAVVGGVAYLTGQSANISMIGCMAGAAVGYTLERYYTNKVSDRYERELKTLKSEMDEIIYERAINNSMGVKGKYRGIVLKETVVPAQEMPDGSWQMETINIKASMPGKGLILGD